MLPLASAGYHVIAPDQRGYGRTTGWDDSYDADPDPFRMLNMVRDAIGLVYALGYRSVAMVVGHDAGAPVASWSALIRPDIFRSVALMSSPFAGAPSLPFDTANGVVPPRPAPTDAELDAELAKLNPPRKYYQNYQRTRFDENRFVNGPSFETEGGCDEMYDQGISAECCPGVRPGRDGASPGAHAYAHTHACPHATSTAHAHAATGLEFRPGDRADDAGA